MIRFLLLHRIEWSDRHQVLMLGGLIGCAIVGGLFGYVLATVGA